MDNLPGTTASEENTLFLLGAISYQCLLSEEWGLLEQGAFKEKLRGSALTLVLHAWESLHDLGYLGI